MKTPTFPPAVPAVVEAPKPVQSTLKSAHPVAPNNTRTALFYVPAHWDIKLEGDTVVAYHNMLGDKFTGSMADFKKMLKG